MDPKYRQFLAILVHFSVMLVVMCPITPYMILVFCLYTGGFFRYAAIAYIIFVYFDWDSRNTGWDHPGYPRILGDNIADYFHAKIIKTAEIPFGRNYILGIHPHGFGCFSGILLRAKKLYENVFGQRRLWYCNHYLLFVLPFVREYGLKLGFISCTFQNLFFKLTKSENIVLALYPGGGLEGKNYGNYYQWGENRLVLKKRKGFCKLALMTGSALIPAYTFGELEVLKTFKVGRTFIKMQDFLYRRFGYGFWNIASLPRRVPITLVLGKPIFVDKVDNPTQDEIDELNGKYIDALLDIYHTYKEKYRENPNVTLVIE